MIYVLPSFGIMKARGEKKHPQKRFVKRSVAKQLSVEQQEHGVKGNRGSNPSCVTTGKLFCLSMPQSYSCKGE